jgi:uncharacterized membrane protein
MRNFLTAWLASAVVILPLDAIWLFSMKNFYQRELGDLLLPSPRFGIAAAFYIMFAAAVAYFAILPNRELGSLQAAVAGGLLGFTAYGTYVLTNYATLRGYTQNLMFADWAWGTVIGALGAGLGFLLWQRFAA